MTSPSARIVENSMQHREKEETKKKERHIYQSLKIRSIRTTAHECVISHLVNNLLIRHHRAHVRIWIQISQDGSYPFTNTIKAHRRKRLREKKQKPKKQKNLQWRLQQQWRRRKPTDSHKNSRVNSTATVGGLQVAKVMMIRMCHYPSKQ